MRKQIVFYINDVRHAIDDELAFMSLACYLREHCRLVATKIVCNEGDCGACSALIGRRIADQERFEYQTLDACIAYLFQLDRTHIVTVEGLGGPNNLSPVQQAMVRCHGSQCGFCTPGFVASMHGMIESKTDFDEDSLRYELSGNLCRCTGYSAIIQAGLEIEPQNCSKIAERFPAAGMIADFEALSAQPVEIQSSLGNVYVARTMSEAVGYRQRHPKAVLVNGATDYGVLRNHGKVEPGETLCLNNVEGFTEIGVKNNILSIGGGATWYRIELFVKDLLPEYYAILTRFGSPQIRKAGTIGGNLASGSPIADAVPFHLAMDAEVELIGATGTRRIKLEEFYLGYRKTALKDDELIAAVHTPLPKDDEYLKLYKISKRRDMDISTATFALWLKQDSTNVTEARIFMGGVGPTVMRMRHSEQCLIGEPATESSFRRAGNAARTAIQPWSDVRGSAAYRLQLAENFLLKSFYDMNALVNT